MKIGPVLCAILGIAAASPVYAASYSVDARDSIYAGADGSLPAVDVSLAGTSATSLSFSASGMISYDIGSGSFFNDPDGIGSNSDIVVSNNGTISGISGDHDGFLSGVFVAPGAPLPSDLSFRARDIGTSFTSLAPALDQAFFIGDGLTGDGTGSIQSFMIPTGATALLLGFADAGGFHGSPGSYDDNTGSFDVTVNGLGSAGAVPEPASWAMMIGGVGLMGGMMRRDLRKSEQRFTKKVRRLAIA